MIRLGLAFVLLMIAPLSALADEAPTAPAGPAAMIVAPDSTDNRLTLTLDPPALLPDGAEWTVAVEADKAQAPEWLVLDRVQPASIKVTAGAPARIEVTFALSGAQIDDEGTLILPLTLTDPRDRAREEAITVPLWVAEVPDLTAAFTPASREGPAKLVLTLATRETVWSPESVVARIGALALAPQIKAEDGGRRLVMEHIFTGTTPGPGTHLVNLQVREARRNRPRDLTLSFDYLLSLAITAHAIDDSDGNPPDGQLNGDERARIALTLETFERTPLRDLRLMPTDSPPLLALEEPPTAPLVLETLAANRPVDLDPLAVLTGSVHGREVAHLTLKATVGGSPFVQQPDLALPLLPGAALVVLRDGPVDDAKQDGTPNNADGKPNPGESIGLPLRVVNTGAQPQPPYTLALDAKPDLLAVADPKPQTGRALAVGDSEAHTFRVTLGKDVPAPGEVPFDAVLEVEALPDALAFPLTLQVPANGPLVALRLPAVIHAFQGEGTAIQAGLPPALMPAQPVFVWAFSDTTETWRTDRPALTHTFTEQTGGMVRVLLYDGARGTLVGAGAGMFIVVEAPKAERERAQFRQALAQMTRMIDGQMLQALNAYPGATIDEKYQALAAAQQAGQMPTYTEDQRIAMLDSIMSSYGASLEVAAVRDGFARLLADPPPTLDAAPGQ